MGVRVGNGNLGGKGNIIVDAHPVKDSVGGKMRLGKDEGEGAKEEKGT